MEIPDKFMRNVLNPNFTGTIKSLGKTEIKSKFAHKIDLNRLNASLGDTTFNKLILCRLMNADAILKETGSFFAHDLMELFVGGHFITRLNQCQEFFDFLKKQILDSSNPAHHPINSTSIFPKFILNLPKFNLN